MEFGYDGGGLAKGGTVELYLDGAKVGEGRVDATIPMVFSADETADIGRDTASPVSDDYTGETSDFTGAVNWVQIDLGEDAEDADHLITPEERCASPWPASRTPPWRSDAKAGSRHVGPFSSDEQYVLFSGRERGRPSRVTSPCGRPELCWSSARPRRAPVG